MAVRCPNCTRKVHIWSNHTGFCSKRCREESRVPCLNCGRVGLFKHEWLGCCSDECRFWYVTSLLGYDREFLLTPAWDKVVYHVRLPSASAEISSLQLDELEFERAHETILVVAAPAWISRQKVLAELPYPRFDNDAWQHLYRDTTFTNEQVERFRRMCYDDPLLYHKLGGHVFQKIRGHGGTSPITPVSTLQLAPGGVPLMPQIPQAPLAAQATPTYQMAPPMPALLAPPALQLPQASQTTALALAPHEFAAQVRSLFVRRGYQVTAASAQAINTLLLTRGGKQALATYIWEPGMVQPEPVQRFLELFTTWEASHGFVVSNGHFTLQVEDMVAGRPVQLIDGEELASLSKGSDPSMEDGLPVPVAVGNTGARAAEPVGSAATVSLQGQTAILHDGPSPGGASSNNGDAQHEEPPAAAATVLLQGKTARLGSEPSSLSTPSSNGAASPEERSANPPPARGDEAPHPTLGEDAMGSPLHLKPGDLPQNPLVAVGETIVAANGDLPHTAPPESPPAAPPASSAEASET